MQYFFGRHFCSHERVDWWHQKEEWAFEKEAAPARPWHIRSHRYIRQPKKGNCSGAFGCLLPDERTSKTRHVLGMAPLRRRCGTPAWCERTRHISQDPKGKWNSHNMCKFCCLNLQHVFHQLLDTLSYSSCLLAPGHTTTRRTTHVRATFGGSDVKKVPLRREAHFEVKMYKTLGVRTTFGGADVASPLRFTTLHYTTLHYTTLHYTTLHHTTLHSTNTTTTTTQLD